MNFLLSRKITRGPPFFDFPTAGNRTRAQRCVEAVVQAVARPTNLATAWHRRERRAHRGERVGIVQRIAHVAILVDGAGRAPRPILRRDRRNRRRGSPTPARAQNARRRRSRPRPRTGQASLAEQRDGGGDLRGVDLVGNVLREDVAEAREREGRDAVHLDAERFAGEPPRASGRSRPSWRAVGDAVHLAEEADLARGEDDPAVAPRRENGPRRLCHQEGAGEVDVENIAKSSRVVSAKVLRRLLPASLITTSSAPNVSTARRTMAAAAAGSATLP